MTSAPQTAQTVAAPGSEKTSAAYNQLLGSHAECEYYRARSVNKNCCNSAAAPVLARSAQVAAPAGNAGRLMSAQMHSRPTLLAAAGAQ
jgi:hypothetical protein